jgi:predicted Rossmann fold flavoprotein
VTLYEATAHPLAKVLVSGGGRCNVTHACFDPKQLVTKYPRGGRELLGAFHRWQPQDTIQWFGDRGVVLKTEEDGRMFPVTDRSATIADCLQGAARRAGVKVVLQQGISAATWRDGSFRLQLMGGGEASADRLLISTGGNRSSAGFTIASSFGHTITPLVPSLFTFTVTDPRLEGLAGLSVPSAEASALNTKLKERGPLLITHAGLSGPAVIKLSAWGARAFAEANYRFILRINFCSQQTVASATDLLLKFRQANPRKFAVSLNPFEIPQRLWERLVVAAGVGAETPWTSIANGAVVAIANQVCAAEFSVAGKSTFKEEFVTCGGVALAEVDFKTMESRQRPGLHFAGEVLDVDGVTGGFNFQAAWTTGLLAGRAMAG